MYKQQGIIAMGLLFGLHQLTQVLHLLQHLFPNFAQVMTRLVYKQQKQE